MNSNGNGEGPMRSILLIGPKVPPYGGMAIQGRLMQELMASEGISAYFLASNLPFPKGLTFLDWFRGLRPFLRSANFCIQLWRLLPRVEVVHILACSWLYFFVIVCPALALSRIRGKRVILNYRGGQADDFLRRSAFALKPFFRLAHVVTAPSQFLVNVLGKRIGVPVQIVPNIINFNRFAYRERDPMQPKMIVTRHLLKLYDIESVIRAFGEVQERYPEASLLIVGTGDQESYLRDLVATLSLRNVDFLGYVPQENLPAIYDRCDILLNASRADNFPGSLVEAAAAGLLVVSTAVGGIPYIFENGISAILVEAADWKALADGVLRALADQLWASRLRAEALRQCQKFDWTNVRRVLYRLYGFDQNPAMAHPGLVPQSVASYGKTRFEDKQ
jgi:glycosyltransferase involved in cell wall biosynthesis